MFDYPFPQLHCHSFDSPMAPGQRTKNVASTPASSTPASSTPASSTPALSAQAIENATDILPKPSKKAWKNGVQLEFLFSEFPTFLDHQDKATLSRFWPRIYDAWYKKWQLPTPAPHLVAKHGSTSNAILVLRSENNHVRLTNFFPWTPDRSYPLLENSHVVPQ